MLGTTLLNLISAPLNAAVAATSPLPNPSQADAHTLETNYTFVPLDAVSVYAKWFDLESAGFVETHSIVIRFCLRTIEVQIITNKLDEFPTDALTPQFE